MSVEFIRQQLDGAYGQLEQSVLPRSMDILIKRGDIEGRMMKALQHLRIAGKLLGRTDGSFSELLTAFSDCEVGVDQVSDFYHAAETDASANADVRSLAASCDEIKSKIGRVAAPFLEDQELIGRLRSGLAALIDDGDELLGKAQLVEPVAKELSEQVVNTTNATETMLDTLSK